MTAKTDHTVVFNTGLIVSKTTPSEYTDLVGMPLKYSYCHVILEDLANHVVALVPLMVGLCTENSESASAYSKFSDSYSELFMLIKQPELLIRYIQNIENQQMFFLLFTLIKLQNIGMWFRVCHSCT